MQLLTEIVHDAESIRHSDQFFTRDAVLELSERAAELAPSSFNAERYTVDVIFSSGAAVERSDLQGRFIEVLEMTSAAADLSEFIGAPVLDAHNRTSSRSIYGTVARRGSIAGAGSPPSNCRGPPMRRRLWTASARARCATCQSAIRCLQNREDRTNGVRTLISNPVEAEGAFLRAHRRGPGGARAQRGRRGRSAAWRP